MCQRIYFSSRSGEIYSCNLGKRVCTLVPSESIDVSGAEKTITQIKKSTIKNSIYEAHILSNTYSQNLSNDCLMDINVKIDLASMNAKRTLFMQGRSPNTINSTLSGECTKDFQIRKFIFSKNAYF